MVNWSNPYFAEVFDEMLAIGTGQTGCRPNSRLSPAIRGSDLDLFVRDESRCKPPSGTSSNASGTGEAEARKYSGGQSSGWRRQPNGTAEGPASDNRSDV